MAGLNQTYNLRVSVDSSDALANLKRIRQELGNISADTSIFKGVDKEFEKISNLFAQLEAEEPLRDTVKGAAAYNKTLSQLSISIGKVGAQLQTISNNADGAFKFKSIETGKLQLKGLEGQIDKISKDLKKMRKDFETPLKSLGIDTSVAKTIEHESELLNILNKELDRRKAIYEKTLQSARVNAAGAPAEGNWVNKNSIQNKGIYNNKENAATGAADIITKELKAGILNAESLQKIETNIVTKLNEAGIVLANQEQIITRVGNAYRAAMTSISQETEKAKMDMEQIGTIGADGTKTFSSQANAAASLARGIESTVDREKQLNYQAQQLQHNIEQQGIVQRNSLSQITQGTQGSVQSLQQLVQREQEVTDAKIEQNKEQDKLNESMKKMQTWLTNILSLTNAWRKFNQIVRQTFNDVKKLDKAFASIAMVTNKTVEGLWATYDDYADMANRLGQTTESAIKASALFYQQGLDTVEALKLTEDTMKLATLAGADFETATKQMTAALRGFHMEMSEGAHVTDVYSELAANAAADVNGIAYAMSKTASIASSAGMSFETTAAFLTNMIETTQEAPENIGTAMKTIIARFTELKENVSASESEFDDLDYNKVDKALKSVGISIKDAQGQFRNLDEVFLELSQKWDTLDRNTQRYIATIAAGSRQQSRFIAMMEDYDRTMELVETAQDSAGRSSEQFAKYQDTVEYKLNQLKNTWEQLRVTIVDSDIFKGVIDSLTKGLKNLSKLNFKRLIPMVAIISPLIKVMIKNFTDGVTKSGQAFQKLGNVIGKRLSAGFDVAGRGLAKNLFGLDTQTLNTAIEAAKAKLAELQKKKDEISNRKILVQADITNAQVELERLNIQLSKMGANDPGRQALVDQINQLKETINTSDTVLEKYDEELKKVEDQEERTAKSAEHFSAQQEKVKAVSSGISAGLTQIGSAATIMATALISGADAATTLKAGLGTMAVSAMNLILQMIPQVISALMAKRAAMEATALKAVATSEIEIAAAKASADAAKKAAAEANAALISSGVGLAVVAMGAAIAGLGLVIKKFIDDAKEARKTANDYLDDAQKKLEEIERLSDTKESSAKESKETVENTEKLIQRYEELNRKLIKTDEEQEEWKELILKINDTFPEIVQSYDEANQRITIQRDLWQDILDIQKEEAAQQKKNASIAKSASIGQQRRIAGLKVDAAKEGGYGLTYKSDWLLGNQNFWGGIQSAQKMGNENNEAYIRRIANYYGADISAIAKQFGYANGPQTEVEWGEFLEELRDSSSKGLENINSIVENIQKNAVDAYKKQQDYYNELEKENVSSTLQAGGTSKNIADFIAKGAFNYRGKGADQLNLKTADEHNLSRSVISDLTFGISDAFWVNDFQKWEELSNEQREILTNIGYEDAEAWNEARKNLADKADFAAQYAEAAYTYNAEKIAKSLDEHLSDENKEIIEEYMSSYTGKTEEQIEYGKERIREIIEASSMSDDDKKTALSAINNTAEGYKDQLIAAKEEIVKVLDDSARDFTNWNLDELEAYKKLIDEAVTSFGSEAAGKAYTKEINNVFGNASGTQINQALNAINWDSAKSMGWEEFKEDAIENLNEIGLKGEEVFKNWEQVQRKWGRLHLSIENEEELQEYIDKLDESVEKISGAREDIAKLNATITKGEKLNLDDYDKYAKAIKELGLEVSDYLRIDKNGNIIANAQKIKNLYSDAYDAQIKSIQAQIDNLEQEKESKRSAIEETYKANKAELESIEYLDEEILKTRQLTLETKKLNLEKVNPENRQFAEDLIKKEEEALAKARIGTEKDKQKALDELYKNYKNQISSLDGWELETRETLIKELAELEARKAADMSLYGEVYREELEKENEAVKDAKEAADDLAEAQEKVAEAMEKVADAEKKVQEALDKIKEKEEEVVEKTNELNKVLYGDPLHSNKLDPMYNYKTQLEQLQKNASRAKDSLLSMQSGDNANQLLASYMENTHGEIVNRKAQNEVIAASIRNYESVISSRLSSELSSLNAKHGSNISTNISDYMTKKNGIYGVNFQALNAAALPDEVSDYVEEVIETMNNLQKEIDDNTDAIKQKEKELRDMRRDALKRRVDLENQVVETLKEKAQEEVDTQKDKYDALKEADNDYLDALEKAINKEKELRERNKEWNDLATKEKKLSLMQRDTSGANTKEVMSLEQDVQDTRENLLDKTIDDIIKGMKEMYELQQESREKELEYQEAMMDSTDWIKQATAIIDGWTTSDDMVTWFVENATKEYTDGSAAVQESMRMSWEDTGNQMVADTQILTTDLTALAETTQSEISVTVNDTSEMLTSQAELTLAQVFEKTEDAITKAEQALEDAIREVQNARDDYRNAIKDLEDAQAAARQAEEDARKAQQDAEEQRATAAAVNGAGIPWSDSSFDNSVNKPTLNYQAKDDMVRKLNSGYLSPQEANKYLKTYGLSVHGSEKNYSIYKSGGLVNYTGPAWVDGTPNEPEAFLSAEDTKRIGTAAELFASLPFFNGGSINNSVNNGDSLIEVHINIENISSDVDLDNALDKMKNAIWEAANPAGSSVILSK